MTSLKEGLNTDRNPCQVLVAVSFFSGSVHEELQHTDYTF